MTPTKCTLIYYIPIACSSYMFWCVSHHHEGELIQNHLLFMQSLPIYEQRLYSYNKSQRDALFLKFIW